MDEKKCLSLQHLLIYTAIELLSSRVLIRRKRLRIERTSARVRGGIVK